MNKRRSVLLMFGICMMLVSTIAGRKALAKGQEKGGLNAVLTALSDGLAVLSHAPTLDGLIAQSKPTLHFADDYGVTLFVWTGTTAKGSRYFRLATPRKYQPKAQAAEWTLFRGDLPVVRENGTPLPQITIAPGAGKPKPVTAGIATQNWSRVVSTDPKGGTVYEIGYYHQWMGECAQGWRLLLLRDAADRWHFVANIPGDFWNDIGDKISVTTNVRWTGKQAAPVELTIENLEENFDPESGATTSPTCVTVWTYSGKLPLGSESNWINFEQVNKGETFSGIVMAFVETDDVDGQNAVVAKKRARALAAEMTKLNPGIHLDRLLVGERLRIPNFEQRESIYSNARKR